MLNGFIAMNPSALKKPSPLPAKRSCSKLVCNTTNVYVLLVLLVVVQFIYRLHFESIAHALVLRMRLLHQSAVLPSAQSPSSSVAASWSLTPSATWSCREAQPLARRSATMLQCTSETTAQLRTGTRLSLVWIPFDIYVSQIVSFPFWLLCSLLILSRFCQDTLCWIPIAPFCGWSFGEEQD
jgi:hypothetical protein